MILNFSCHLEMLTLERAISIGTCGLVQSVRTRGWGREGGDGLSELPGLPGHMVPGLGFKEESVGVRCCPVLKGWHCTGGENGAGQRDILLACRPTGLASSRMPPRGAGRADRDLFYLRDPTSLKRVCG